MRFNVKFTALALAGAIALFGGASASAKPGDTVVVSSGDTLSAIGAAHGSDYVRIFNANPQIANPDVINAGDQLRVPTADEQLPDRLSQLQAAQAAYVAPAQSVATNYGGYQQSNQQPVAAPVNTGGSSWEQIAQCESGGNWSINTGNGYSGGLQFSPGTWSAYGDGSASAAQASKEAQIAAAEKVLAAQGWGAWPSCSAKAGLR
ncbi:transglycosylase family protein [Candidatus Saccharibacteria bacterium]|nr:transglycosylase family protein [Candidatus Saccharibacteria bacterium]MBH2007079.1 transglycosylase family protein [Candidatus Saccharibacteria bacterium]